MNRREPQADGSLIVWNDAGVRLYDATRNLVESRPLTPAEAAAHDVWAEAQPDAANRRAMRDALAATISEEVAARAQLDGATTPAAIVAAIKRMRR